MTKLFILSDRIVLSTNGICFLKHLISNNRTRITQLLNRDIFISCNNPLSILREKHIFPRKS